ncbi:MULTISPECIES: phosphoglycerate dehydrogenase [Anaerotruncus]|uniref:phosphoglycerate dehydrogenase n=1 Tax=Anaerotruncus TaxID=244127 RepID=UPI00082C2100|nr:MULTISPECIES: phosphoglycerate dehydrogenase [Anaerotruncus]RGX56277.1 3-phosphoglycerate dehydrogenase [Anaerotruncus sp. AF02-27]
MYNIQILNKISPNGLDVFDKNKYRISDDVGNPDGILVRSASMHEMELPESLEAVARAGAGVNNIPVDKCSERGIVVFNTPGANANAVKEMVICGLLISARKIYPGMVWVQTLKGEGENVPKLVEKGKSKFVGPELYRKKLGVIGLGAIGVMVANFARHLGMEVYGYDPYMSVDTAWNVSRDIKHATSLREIYENCDFITLHVPATSETKGMINSESIAMMKHGVRILNFARGELVVNEDLLEGLEEKQIRCYVTDFPSEELLGQPGVLVIPHLGASTPESEDNCAKMAAQQMVDYLENGNIQNSVNMPSIHMDRSGDIRVAIIHRNIPAMLTKITTILSDEGLNVENLTNKSRRDFAYTMVDINGVITDDIVAKLRAIEGVIRVNIFH